MVRSMRARARSTGLPPDECHRSPTLNSIPPEPTNLQAEEDAPTRDGSTASTSALRILLKRLSTAATGQVVTFAVGMSNQIVLTHALRVEGYGRYALVMTSAALLAWAVSLGSQIALPAWVRGDAARARACLGIAAAYLGVLGALAGAGFLLMPLPVSRLMSATIDPSIGRWLLPTTVASLIYFLSLGLLSGLTMFRAYAVVSVANVSILLALNLLWLTADGSGQRALLHLNLAYVASGALAITVLLIRIGAGAVAPWRSLFRERGAATWRIYVASLTRMVLLRTPFYLVERLLGPVALGLYALADYLMNLIWRPTGIAGQVLQASAAAEERAVGPLEAAWLGRVLGAITLVAFGLIALMRPAGFVVVFGRGFGATYPILLLLAPGAWAYAVFVALDYYYAAHDYPWMLARTFLASAGVTLLLGLPLAKHFGVAGVAAAYGTGLMAVLFLGAASFARTHQIRWRAIVAPTSGDVALVRELLRRRKPDSAATGGS